ncbi:Autophagy protein 22 [Pleosporales sp. CAS-2024a]
MSQYDEDEGDVQDISVRYEGEDTRPTSTRELNGWYLYPVAAEVYAVVAVGAFFPVLLEQLARANGHFYSDPRKPCIVVDHDTSKASASARIRNGHLEQQGEQCMIEFLGRTMSSSSFAMYTFSAAVLVQAVVLIGGSSFADYGPYRKKMLLALGYMGSMTSASFIFITPRVYYLAPLLVIIGITCMGCTFVLLNAFLPLLVAHDASESDGDHLVGRAKSLGSSSDADADADADSSLSDDYELEAFHSDINRGAAKQVRRSDPSQLARHLERSAQISSRGIAYGYMAAVLVQIMTILILWLFSTTAIQERHPTLPIRVILLLVGIWWAAMSTPTLLWLRPRPGPPLPSQEKKALSTAPSKFRTFCFYTSFSLRSFWRTLRRAMSLKQTRIFLISWFLLSDAVATISGTAVLFARTVLHMGTIAVALLSITVITSGILGAFAWPRIQKHFGMQPKTVLLCCVIGMEIVPLYGLLGFLPVFKRLGFIGLQQPWEIYPIGVLHGMIMGGISSYARTVYGPLIPEGSETAFFALYAVTDKGSSAVGPALVGWIVDNAGSIRPAFIFLAVAIVLPAPLLWWLDVERGREDARAMAEGQGGGLGTYARVRGHEP